MFSFAGGLVARGAPDLCIRFNANSSTSQGSSDITQKWFPRDDRFTQEPRTPHFDKVIQDPGTPHEQPSSSQPLPRVLIKKITPRKRKSVPLSMDEM
ncbi:hypothetical protein ZEAMMB73_Zm00001d028174 [Zea mays]|uniref:Uncharacterized protein n=1 Tax=Zea mays TaxID=4577 RepID=A0A1D6JSI4_MAIZE|nr:hypothetical protein ZEAMMB73_Zm00001d028174 [Zea mays]